MNKMERYGISATILALSLLGAGCNNTNGEKVPAAQLNDACANQDECPTGSKCVDSICRALCLAPDQCDQGFGCRDGICQKCTADGQCKNHLNCDISNGICLARCENINQCHDGFFCSDNGTCNPKLSVGATATTADQCASGFLSDGVCCDTACDTDCFACNLDDHKGTCSPLDASSEGVTDGTCLGGNTFCTDQPGQYAEGSFCGAGRCQERVKKQCPGNLTCKNDACLDKCTTDSDCLNNLFCDVNTASSTYGQCIGELSKGHACDEKNSCGSGLFCNDGVCCTSASCEPCMACNMPGSEGECTPKAAGESDELCTNKCSEDNSTALSYSCDGNGSCSLLSKETDCGGYKCDSGECHNNCVAMAAMPSGVKPSAQNLKKASEQYCNPDYFCEVGDATSVNYMVPGKCQPKYTNGHRMDQSGLAYQCQSGFIADSVCCNSKCDGVCQSCNQAETGKKNGQCNYILPGKQDSSAACNSVACTFDGDMAGSYYDIYDVCDGSGKCLTFASNFKALGLYDGYQYYINEYIDNNYTNDIALSLKKGAYKECPSDLECMYPNYKGETCRNPAN